MYNSTSLNEVDMTLQDPESLQIGPIWLSDKTTSQQGCRQDLSTETLSPPQVPECNIPQSATQPRPSVSSDQSRGPVSRKICTTGEYFSHAVRISYDTGPPRRRPRSQTRIQNSRIQGAWTNHKGPYPFEECLSIRQLRAIASGRSTGGGPWTSLSAKKEPCGSVTEISACLWRRMLLHEGRDEGELLLNTRRQHPEKLLPLLYSPTSPATEVLPRGFGERFNLQNRLCGGVG